MTLAAAIFPARVQATPRAQASSRSGLIGTDPAGSARPAVGNLSPRPSATAAVARARPCVRGGRPAERRGWPRVRRHSCRRRPPLRTSSAAQRRPFRAPCVGTRQYQGAAAGPVLNRASSLAASPRGPFARLHSAAAPCSPTGPAFTLFSPRPLLLAFWARLAALSGGHGHASHSVGSVAGM